MNKEEAIKQLKKHKQEIDKQYISSRYSKAIEVALNLIQKQEKEIKNLKEDISNMYDEKVVRNILENECGLSKYEIDEILN